jgi:hypothetical protein
MLPLEPLDTQYLKTSTPSSSQPTPGYQRLAFSAKRDSSYAVRWVQQPWEVDFNDFRPGQQVFEFAACTNTHIHSYAKTCTHTCLLPVDAHAHTRGYEACTHTHINAYAQTCRGKQVGIPAVGRGQDAYESDKLVRARCS